MHIHNLNHSNTARGPQLRGHAMPSPAALQARPPVAGPLSRLPPGRAGELASPEQSVPVTAWPRTCSSSSPRPCHRRPRASSITQTQTRSTPASPEQSQAQTAARSLEICSSGQKWAHRAAALPQSNAVRDHSWRPPSALAHSRPRADAPVRASLAVVRARIPFASLVRGARLLLCVVENPSLPLCQAPNPLGPSPGIQPAVRNSARSASTVVIIAQPSSDGPRDDCVTPARRRGPNRSVHASVILATSA